jgi:LysM repeat protein
MYWYYKYMFLGLVLMALLGCGYLVYTHVPPGLISRFIPAKVLAKAETATNADPETPAQVPASAAAPQQDEPSDTGAPVSANEGDLLARLDAARGQFRKENAVAARMLARKVLAEVADQEFSTVWLKAVTLIGEANTVLISGDAPAPEKIAYVIKGGDRLIDIARAFNTSVEMLQLGNRLDPTSSVIYPGAVLSIYRGDWRILIHKDKYALLLMDGDTLFKMYQVGIGRQNRTPAGVFKIHNKITNPPWTPPGKMIPFGDPENVLGTRWMGLKPVEGTSKALQGLGIHGTWEPETVGTPASKGCIRMRNEEVAELFNIVPVGTRVEIRDD